MTGAGQAFPAPVPGLVHMTHADATAVDDPRILRITGLPGTAVREARDRVYAAIINSGQAWPAWTITIDLLPASLPRHGTGFGLAIDVAAVTPPARCPLLRWTAECRRRTACSWRNGPR
jgi:magnesium chelatase family protein